MFEPRRNLRRLPDGVGRTHPLPSAKPTTILPGAAVVVLRQRRVVQPGALRDRSFVAGDRLVTAHDTFGQAWWIPAVAVWSDADGHGEPERPNPVGLATATSRGAAVVAGLSDRLGWEAVAELEQGNELPVAPVVAECSMRGVTVLDGRLDHDVPTVVVVGAESVRWGAGATWPAAVRRACYGAGGGAAVEAASELHHLRVMLDRCGLAIAGVGLDTPMLRRAGVARCSVQLMLDTPRYVRGTRVR